MSGTANDIVILGLGNMGKALVQCYSKKGYQVHAWNRGEKNRKAVEALVLDNVKVYSDLKSAVEAAELIIMSVIGDKDLATATKII